MKMSLLLCSVLNIIILLILWEIHKCLECVLIILIPHSFPQLLLDLLLPNSQLYIFFYFILIYLDQFVLPRCPWVWRQPLERCWLTRNHTPKENWLFLHLQRSAVHSSSAGYWWFGNPTPICVSMLIVMILMQVAIADVKSCVQWFSHVQETVLCTLFPDLCLSFCINHRPRHSGNSLMRPESCTALWE